MPDVQEPVIAERSQVITELGAVPDGRTLATEAIAKGISALADKGGGRLVFPPGLWLTGPIVLKSNIELHLEEGALVRFSYDASKDERDGLVRGAKLENVAISGHGIFDGNGDAWRPVKRSKMTDPQWKRLLASGGITDRTGEMWWPSRALMNASRPTLLHLYHCRKIRLEGVTFQNSPGWNLNPDHCEEITVRNLTVRNPWYSQNGDGLDLESCRNVVVRASTFDVGDDAICIKSGSGAQARREGVPTENVLVEDCTVYHGHGGFTIGSEMSGGVRNIRVNNCTFIGTDIGLRFKSTRGRGGIVEKIYISNVRMTDIPGDAINFNMYYGGKAPLEEDAPVVSKPSPIPVSEETPQFRDIVIENVICRGAKGAVTLQGLPEMPIRAVHLKNVSITSESGAAWVDAQDITFENVEIVNTKGPVLNVTRTKDALIDGLSYRAGIETVINATGDEIDGIVIKNTDLKAAVKDFVFTKGAGEKSFKVQ